MNNLILLAIPLIFYFSFIFGKKFNIIDKPNNRKVHSIPIVATGGIAVLLTTYLIIWATYFDIVLADIFFYGFFILIIGVIDDKYNLNISIRLLFYFFIVFYFTESSGLQIDKIYITNTLSISLGGFKLIFTILAVLLIINSCNYIDGLDGLLTLNIILILTFFILIQKFTYSYINFDLIYVIIALLIYTFFNYQIFNLPKMFLGNGGSYTLGFILANICIYYGFFSEIRIHPLIIMWLLGFFVFEFISINFSRIIRKKGIFNPGKDHIQYLFFDYTKSHFLSTLGILFLSTTISLIGILLYKINFSLNILIYLVSFTLYFYIREHIMKKKSYFKS